MVFRSNSTELERISDKTAVIILGGGQGKRLYPLTKERSKPAVPVAGKFRLIDLPISNCLHSQLDRIYILTQFNSDSLHRHISMTYRFDVFSSGFVQILAAQQTPENLDWYQGTADAVRQSLRRLAQRRPEHVLILSGDHLYKMDYRKMLRAHIESNADVTVSVLPIERDRCADFGILQIDDTGRILNFVEKPKEDSVLDNLTVPEEMFQDRGIESGGREFIASMGIYAFRTQTLFDALKEHKGTDFGKDILPALLQPKQVLTYFFDGYWEDIGTIRSFYEANLALTTPVPQFNFFDEQSMIYSRPRFLPGSKINEANVRASIVCDGAIVSGSAVEDSIIGLRSVIAEGAEVKRTVMMGADYYDSPELIHEDVSKDAPPLGIGPRTVVHNAIIDKNARIGADCRLVNQEGTKEGDRDNLFIRDGIIVVPRKAVIPAGTVV